MGKEIIEYCDTCGSEKVIGDTYINGPQKRTLCDFCAGSSDSSESMAMKFIISQQMNILYSKLKRKP